MSIFGENLKRLRKENHITQAELSSSIGIERSSIGKYETADVIPSMDVLKKLADYFNVSVGDLLEEKKEKVPSAKEDTFQYYIDDEVQQIAQDIHDDPYLRILFSASRNLKKEDIKFVVDMVERLKKG